MFDQLLFQIRDGTNHFEWPALETEEWECEANYVWKQGSQQALSILSSRGYHDIYIAFMICDREKMPQCWEA